MATSAPLAFVDSNALIRKIDLRESESSRRIISGYANVAGLEDSQGDIVTLDALRDAWSRWRSNPDFCILSLLHSNIPLAKVIFEDVIDSKGNIHRSGVDDTGLYIVAEVREDTTVANEAWKKIERGELRGFSIGGRNLSPQAPVCEGDKCVRPITSLELYEVAIVDQPANRVSLFNMLKRDDLAKLADVTRELSERIISEGAVKISKKPCPDSGHYHLLVKEGVTLDGLCPEKFAIVTEPREGEEYMNLFDLALLRPESGLTGEAWNGGVNPPPLKAEKPDTPTPPGGLSLEKEEEEVNTEKESSKGDESELSEAPTEEEVKEAEQPAVAPVTLETLMAELARLNERLGNLEAKSVEKAVWSVAYVNDLPDSSFAYIEPGGEKDGEGKTTPRSKRHLPYKDKDGKVDAAHVRNALARLSQTQISAEAKESARRKLLAAAKSAGVEAEGGEDKAEKMEKSATPPTEPPKAETPKPAEPPKKETPVIVAPAAPPQPEPAPKPEPTKPELKPVEKPPEQPKAAPAEAPPVNVIETRGVAPPQTVAPRGFNVAEMHKVPWSEIHEAKEASLEWKIKE